MVAAVLSEHLELAAAEAFDAQLQGHLVFLAVKVEEELSQEAQNVHWTCFVLVVGEGRCFVLGEVVVQGLYPVELVS